MPSITVPTLPSDPNALLDQVDEYYAWQQFITKEGSKIVDNMEYWFGANPGGLNRLQIYNMLYTLSAANPGEATALKTIVDLYNKQKMYEEWRPTLNNYYPNLGAMTVEERLNMVSALERRGFTTAGEVGNWLKAGEETKLAAPIYGRLMTEEQNLGVIPSLTGAGVAPTTTAPLPGGGQPGVWGEPITPYAPGQGPPGGTPPALPPKTGTSGNAYADFYNFGYTYIKNRYPQISDTEIAQALNNIWAAHGTQLAGITTEQLQQFLQNPAIMSAITPQAIAGAAAGQVGSTPPTPARVGFYGETEYTPEEIQQFRSGAIGGVEWEDLYRKMKLRREARFANRGGAEYERTRTGELALAGLDLTEY